MKTKKTRVKSVCSFYLCAFVLYLAEQINGSKVEDAAWFIAAVITGNNVINHNHKKEKKKEGGREEDEIEG